MRFLFVMMAIFILEPTQQQYQRSVPSCTENGQTFCWSCNTAARCISSAGSVKQYNTTCTGSTPLCGPDTSNPPKYSCTGNTIADCSCTGTGSTYKSDPYSDRWYILCSGTTALYIDCGDDLFYNEAEHNCVNYEPSPTTTTTTTTTTPTPSICSASGAGAHDYNNTCDTYFVCTSSSADPIDGTCQVPTNYFDPVSNECKEPPTRFQCPPGAIGTLGDPFDCRRYYVCFDQELFDVGCCGITQVFNVDVEKCITGIAPPGCPLSDECAVETTSPMTSTPDGITSTSTTTSSSTSTPEGITSTSTSTSSLTSTPEGITSTSTPTSSSTSTGITSTSTVTSPSTSTTTIITTTSTITSTLTSTPDGITSTSTTTSPSTSPFTSSSTTITTTTNQAPSCTPISSFVCPSPDGFFPECNYCARTYFRCVSGSATQGTCTGSTVFNTVPSYPSCLSPEFCPYYP